MALIFKKHGLDVKIGCPMSIAGNVVHYLGHFLYRLANMLIMLIMWWSDMAASNGAVLLSIDAADWIPVSAQLVLPLFVLDTS